jgi:epoxide hydrolase
MELQFSPPVPFKVSIPQKAVDDFQSRLSSADVTSFQTNLVHPDPPAKVGVDGRILGPLDFSYGMPPSVLPALVQAAKSFSWKAWEERINGMGEHRKITVSGSTIESPLDIHFVRLRGTAESTGDDPKRQGTAAILLIHGWPGSFLEFWQISPLLAQAGYDVVMPSLPGYGFSSSPKSSVPSGTCRNPLLRG